jgi:hypothetical protein
MHTALMTAGGLSLLSLILGLAQDRGAAARRFIPVWGLISFLDLGYGVGVHHYGFFEELGVHVIVFGVPAALAFWVGRTRRPQR